MRLAPTILERYLAGTFARTVLATLAGILAVVLVIDFADRAYSFKGEGWVLNVLKLYVNLAADFGYQIAPSALVLAAGITVSGLRSQGELTALNSLGYRPAKMIASILVACGLICAGIVLVNEWVVVGAARKAEEIKRTSFSRKPGDFRAYLEQQKWFRSGEWVYNLRVATERGFEMVSLYELDQNFSLRKRIDAASMEWNEGGVWTLQDATVSTFAGGERRSVERSPTLEIHLAQSLADLRIDAGKPREMSMPQLFGQIRLRQRLGLEAVEFRHELYNRLAYPFASVPGALIAIRLALRRRRTGHLATAIAEALAISLAMFTLWTMFRAMGISGLLPPGFAAVAPLIILALAGTATDLYQRLAARHAIPKELSAA